MSQSKKRYQILNPLDSSSLNALLDEIDSDNIQIVSYDLETNSAVEKLAKVIGIGLSFYPDEGFYIPIRKYNPETKILEDLIDADFEKSFINELCSILLKKKLVMWNGVYDCAVTYHRYGIDLIPALFADGILMKHTIDEERPFGLKEVAELYKDRIGFTEEESANQEQMDLKASVIKNGGKWTKANKEIYKGDLELIGTYCCADTDLTLKLCNYFDQRLEEEGLTEFFYDQEVMPLYKKATIPMKYHGVYVDINHFRRLEKELESDIIRLTASIFNLIKEDIEPYVQQILDGKIKETRTGKYAEGVLQHYNIPIPINKRTGKPTLAKSALQSLLTAYPGHPALEWLLHQPKLIQAEVEEEYKDESGDGVIHIRRVTKSIPDPSDQGPPIPSIVKYAVKREIFVEANPDLPHVFNLSSNEHLSWLVFEHYGEDPRGYSKKTDKPTVDKDSLETYDHLPFIKALLELKKAEKLLSTYVKPILETNIDGWIYPSMFQFGTTSGRYSCGGGLNLQTLPRFEKLTECPTCESKQVKITEEGLTKFKVVCGNCQDPQYVMNNAMIKKGFIAPPGYKVVNADFSSLEPRIFSWVCGDPGLKRVWTEGLDLYSQIAIDVFGLEDVSAKEGDPDYLKKVNPGARQKSKTFCLDENTIVQTKTGWKRISEISVGEEVHTKFGFKTVTNKFGSTKQAIKFHTSKGTIICTPDHKIWSETDGTFKFAQDFKPGELLEYIEASPTEGQYQSVPLRSNASFKNGSELPIATIRIDETWAWLLGAFLGDGIGSYTRRQQCAKQTHNSHLISSYVGICGLENDGTANHFVAQLQKFGYRLSHKRKTTKISGNFDTYTCSDFELVKIFQDSFKAFNPGVGEKGSKNLRVQPFIFNSPVSVRIAYLAGLFDTDGYTKTNKTKKNITAAICSKSYEFATDLINLLRTLGVESRLQCSYNKTYKRDYYIACISTGGVSRLAQLGIKTYMKVKRKSVVFDQDAGRQKKMPVKLFKTETHKECNVVDITVESVHEFEVNGIRVHNCLAVPYGANAWRIAETTKEDPKVAQQWINNYLEAYPGLKDYMMSQEIQARTHGFVKTKFGRVRHLPQAKELYRRYKNTLYSKKAMIALLGEEFGSKIYYEYRNQLNNAKNFPIQATAAHVANGALIKLADLFQEYKVEGWIALQIHDEITCIVREKEADRSANMLQDSMENNVITRQIDIPILAEPVIGNNFSETK